SARSRQATLARVYGNREGRNLPTATVVTACFPSGSISRTMLPLDEEPTDAAAISGTGISNTGTPAGVSPHGRCPRGIAGGFNGHAGSGPTGPSQHRLGIGLARRRHRRRSTLDRMAAHPASQEPGAGVPAGYAASPPPIVPGRGSRRAPAARTR